MHFRTEQFQLQEMNKSYVAEASELGIGPGVFPGVLSLNGYTFEFGGYDMDASGEDVMGWRYKPTETTLAASRTFQGWQVLIIND